MKGKILWLSLFLLLMNSFVPNVMVSVPGQESSRSGEGQNFRAGAHGIG